MNTVRLRCGYGAVMMRLLTVQDIHPLLLQIEADEERVVKVLHFVDQATDGVGKQVDKEEGHGRVAAEDRLIVRISKRHHRELREEIGKQEVAAGGDKVFEEGHEREAPEDPLVRLPLLELVAFHVPLLEVGDDGDDDEDGEVVGQHDGPTKESDRDRLSQLPLIALQQLVDAAANPLLAEELMNHRLRQELLLLVLQRHLRRITANVTAA